MKSIILFGNGGHCKACIDIIETSNEYKIKGLIVHTKDNIKEFMNYKVIGNDSNFHKTLFKEDSAIICVGQISSSKKRRTLFNLLKENNVNIATIISNSSIISRHALIDIGSAVMHNVVINAGAEVGVNCILNTNSLIEHDVKIGNHCHISTGAIVNGAVEIGNDCFVGSGSIIREGVIIGDRCIISAGEIVMENLTSDTIFKNKTIR